MHQHNHHAHDERRMLWALLLTASFMVAEVIGGLISGSLALLADAGHMLTDTGALALAWLAARAARRPADTLRSYGYHRIQIVAALVNGVVFILLVIWIVIEAVQRFLEPVQVLGGVMFWVAVAGLGVNLLAFAILHGGAKTNLNLRGALVHVMGDLLGSVAAISAAIVIILTGWMPIDPLLSIFVAMLILRSAWFVVRQSVHILLEGTPEDVDIQLLKSTLTSSVPDVTDVHHVHVWSLTPGYPLLTMHVNVKDTNRYSETLCEIHAVLKQRFNIQHATVQIEVTACVDDPNLEN